MFQFIPISSCPVTGHHWRKVCFCCLSCPQGFFCRLDNPKSFSYCLYSRCCSPLITFVAHHWTQYSVLSLSLLHWWTQHSLVTLWGWAEGKKHLPWPFFNALPDASQETVAAFYTKLCCGKYCLPSFLLEKELWNWKLFWAAGFLIHTKQWCQWDVFMSEWFRDAKMHFIIC